MIGLPKGLFDFQEDCVSALLNSSIAPKKDALLLKAPTGAGKTIILIDYIDKYLSHIDSNTCFIWLSPGKGELEEQSMAKLKKHLPERNAKTLNDVLGLSFESEDVVFINWELVTNKSNKSITESERKNLFELIADAHRNNLKFMLVIDEEHSHDTAKAKDIINAFAAKYKIRVSATTKENKLYDYYEIPEIDVINSGLITKALYINEDVQENIKVTAEYEYLLKLAINKRIEIQKKYKDLSKDINPLILIQFPDMSDVLIKDVESYLESLGYTYENKLMAKWMSDSEDKINLQDISNNDAKPQLLLMKQAISTGWDCPRAKILVKLRENMNENFTIQTIGRIRRMPEACHYEEEILDNCYLYTFDEKYKQVIKQEISTSFDVIRLYLKDKCKDFKLTKQIRDLDYDGLGEREAFNVINKYFIQKYKLDADKQANLLKLRAEGYDLSDLLVRQIKKGQFVKTESVLDNKFGSSIDTHREVDTHKHGMELLHSIDAIKSAIGIQHNKLRTILERMFRNSVRNKDKILSLNTKKFYAFIINNEQKLKQDFKDATAQLGIQKTLNLNPRTSEFKLPEVDLIRYDASEVDYEIVESNAYENYPTSCIVDGIRSLPERLFERYCEGNPDVEWIYKNGDTGQQYFSIVYVDSLQKQWLFYPDYIVMLKNGDTWIIETKGGEMKYGQSKNIDRQTLNKFEAFKAYATQYNVNWGFVRDKNEILRINNTIYSDDMSDSNWIKLKDVF